MNRTKSKTHGSQYSATSVDSMSHGGGLLSPFGYEHKATFAAQTCLDAFKDKKPDVARYILENALSKGQQIDFSLQDCSGRTILHYLVCYAANNQAIKQLLISCVSLEKCKKYINLQDDSGNTPTHYALYLGAEDIVRFLAENGADLKIKNGKGYSIELSSVPVMMQEMDRDKSNVFLSRDDERTGTDEEQQLNSFLKQIVNQFMHTSEGDSMSFDRGSARTDNGSVNASDFVNRSVKSQPQPQQKPRGGPTRRQMKELSISDFGKTNTVDGDIDEFVMEQFGGVGKMMGGGNGCGLRRVINYSDMSGGEHSSSESASSSDRMAREVTEASQAHERSLDKIAAIIGLAKDALEVKAVKALLYEKIQEENAELVKAGQPIRTNHERAIVLEQRASDSGLVNKTFKNKAEMRRIIDIINKRAEERAANVEARRASQNSTSDSEGEGKKRPRKREAKQERERDGGSGVSDTSDMSDGNEVEIDVEEDEIDIS